MADGTIPQEVKAQLDALQVTLKASRDKQDELDKQVKKLGEDAVTKAEQKKIDAAFEKIREDINGVYKAMRRPAVAQLDAKSQEIETKANLLAAKWIGKEGDDAAGAAFRVHYKSGFDKWARAGRDGSGFTDDERKAISVGSGPDGGLYVEPTRADWWIQRLRETSAMRAIASIVNIGQGSNSYKINVDRDDVGYGWVGELASRTATATPQFGEVEIPVHEMYAMPSMSQNALDDMAIDIEGVVNEKVLDRFGRAENTAFSTGNGSKQPTGFLSQVQGAFVTTADATRAFGALQYLFTGVSGGFATIAPADKLLDMIYAFNAGYRSSLQWAGNRTTLGAVRKFKDDNDNYIYNPQLGANGIIDMVLGYKWNEFADIADYTTANAFAVALGDFKRGYQIVDRQGIRQLRDPLTSKGSVLFYTTKRAGGAITDSDAIKLLKFGTS